MNRVLCSVFIIFRTRLIFWYHRQENEQTARSTSHLYADVSVMGFCSIRAVLLITAFVCLSACQTTEHEQSATDPQAVALLDDARMMLAEGNFAMAMALTDSVLVTQPASADAYFLRGQILLQRRYVEEAEAAYRAALEIDDAYPSAWFNLGNIAFLRRQYTEAIDRYNQEMAITEAQYQKFGTAYAVRYGETMSRLAVQKGRAQRQLAEDDLAIAAFEQAIAYDSLNADAYADLSQSLKDAGKPEAAVPYATQALSLVPVDPDYNYILGALKHELGASKDAVPFLQRSLQLKPWLASARYSLGLALVELGEEDAGKLQLQLADTLQVLNDRIEKARFESQSYPNQHSRWINLGRLLIQAGRIDEAVQPLSVAEALQPDDLTIKNDLANLALVRGDTLAATRKLEAILAAAPDFADGWYNLGVVYAMQGAYGEARRAWEETLRHNPNHPEARQSIDRLPGS